MAKKYWWLKDGLIYGLSATLSKFTGIFLAPIYTRFLTTAQFGLLDLATSFSAVLLVVAEMQMVSGFMRNYIEAKEKKSVASLTGSVMVFYFVSTSLIAGIVWVGRGLIQKYVPEFDFIILLPILIGLLPAQITSFYLVFLRMERRPRQYLFISAGQIALAAVLGIIFVVPFHLGTLGALYGFAGARVVFGLISFGMIIKNVGIRLNVDHVKEMLHFGAPLVPARVSSWARTYINRFFIVSMLSMSMLGIFSIANKIAGISLLLIMSIRLVWQPFENEQYTKSGSEERFARVLNIFIFAILAFQVLLTIGSPVVLRLLAPPAYWSAEPFIALLSMGILWDGAVMFFSVGNNWARKTYHNSFGASIASFFNIVLLFFGTAKLGLPLVALSAFLSVLIKCLLILRTSQKNHYIPYSTRMIAFGMGLSGMYSVLPYCALTFFKLSVPASIVFYAISGMMALLVMWAFVLVKEDKQWFLSMLKVRTV